MCRRDHPSFPSEITCCFLSVLKTLLMPSEPIRALSGVNVPGFPMAGFQLTLYGRFWATPEVGIFDFSGLAPQNHPECKMRTPENRLECRMRTHRETTSFMAR